MSKGQPVKYSPTPQQRSTPLPHLCLVPSQSSQGVGVEATEVALCMEKLSSRINMTETLMRALLSHLEEDIAPVPYNHVEAKYVGTLKVRYRNVGPLLPRKVTFDEE